MVVITTAAPVVAPRLPAACVLRMAVASAFWVSCWIFALRLVTSVSPATGAVRLMVPVTSPAALTDTSWLPARPRSSRSYCCSSPDWPTRSTPEKPVTVRCRWATCCGVIGCR